METITLYKDTNGNLWYYEGYDETDKFHKVTVVEEDNGHYINTNITWYMTDKEFTNCIKIEVEV